MDHPDATTPELDGDPAESVQPAEPVAPAEATNAAPIESAAPVTPAEVTNADQVWSAEAAEAAESVESAEPVDPIDPVAGGWDWSTPDPIADTSEHAAIPPAWPTALPTPPPVAGSAPAAGGPSTRRSALVGALVGAVVAALVAAGVTVSLRDDNTSSASRPIATPIATAGGALDIQGILAKVQDSVVAIETSQTTSRGVFQGAGSGIVLSKDGLILTNAHVIGSLGKMTVVLADGTQHDATLVGASPDDDLAVIKISGVKDLVPAELGSSDALRVGDEVIAIGNALNLGGEPTVTRGIVSAKDRDLDAEGVSLKGLIQTDAAINPGNSGGPLVNAAGQVVGMNTAIVADAQNLGFSIAIDHAKPIIKELQAGKGSVTPDQAFLGVSSTDVAGLADAVRQRFGVDRSTGAFVTEVVPASAAAKGGLEVGDVITQIDATKVDTASDVRTTVTKRAPGDKVTLHIVRAGQDKTLEITLGQRSAGT